MSPPLLSLLVLSLLWQWLLTNLKDHFVISLHNYGHFLVFLGVIQMMAFSSLHTLLSASISQHSIALKMNPFVK